MNLAPKTIELRETGNQKQKIKQVLKEKIFLILINIHYNRKNIS